MDILFSNMRGAMSAVLLFLMVLAYPASAATVATIGSEADLKSELTLLGFDATKAHLRDEPEFFSLKIVGGPVLPFKTLDLTFFFKLMNWKGFTTIKTIESGQVSIFPPKIIPDDIVRSTGLITHKTNPHPTDVHGGTIRWTLAWSGGRADVDLDSDLHLSKVSDHLDKSVATLSGTEHPGRFGNEIDSWTLTANVNHIKPNPPLPPSIPLPASGLLIVITLSVAAIAKLIRAMITFGAGRRSLDRRAGVLRSNKNSAAPARRQRCPSNRMPSPRLEWRDLFFQSKRPFNSGAWLIR